MCVSKTRAVCMCVSGSGAVCIYEWVWGGYMCVSGVGVFACAWVWGVSVCMCMGVTIFGVFCV